MDFLLAEEDSTDEDKAKEELRQEYKVCFSQGCNNPFLLWRPLWRHRAQCCVDIILLLRSGQSWSASGCRQGVDRELPSVSLVCAQIQSCCWNVDN